MLNKDSNFFQKKIHKKLLIQIRNFKTKYKMNYIKICKFLSKKWRKNIEIELFFSSKKNFWFQNAKIKWKFWMLMNYKKKKKWCRFLQNSQSNRALRLFSDFVIVMPNDNPKTMIYEFFMNSLLSFQLNQKRFANRFQNEFRFKFKVIYSKLSIFICGFKNTSEFQKKYPYWKIYRKTLQ